MRNASTRRLTQASSSARHGASLAAAQHAVDEKKMIVAQQFADEARAEAELAAAKAGAVKAKAVNDDIKRSTATLDRRDAAQDRRQPMNNSRNLSDSAR